MILLNLKKFLKEFYDNFKKFLQAAQFLNVYSNMFYVLTEIFLDFQNQ